MDDYIPGVHTFILPTRNGLDNGAKLLAYRLSDHLTVLSFSCFVFFFCPPFVVGLSLCS